MQQSRPTALGILFVVLTATFAHGQAADTKKREPAPSKDSPPPAPKAAPAAQKALPRSPDEPRILTSAEMDKRAKGSIFLSGPGTDKYGEAVPWSEIPEWRQASFYGVRSVAQTVVYVVDSSGSMAEADRILRAKAELRRSVMSLRFPQRFTVIFYNQHPMTMPGTTLKSPDAATKDQFLSWLRSIEPDGGTDPRGALRIALSLSPDAIFLLSDGAFPDGVVEETAERNTKKTPIHCIDLAGGSAGDHLKRIARDSGGQYASRP